jgi:undecaprenyl-diphosphatase
MTSLEALILGIIQGFTEFLPVSSSGHLELGQYFLGLSDLHQYVLFDLVCHLGTLLSILCVLYKPMDRKRFFQIMLGTLPLIPLVFFLKPIKSTFDQPQYLGYCFLFTAALLFLGTKKNTETQPKPLRDPLLIGLFQAIAILPGISRSGSTISAARFLGWTRQEAVLFSFQLAIPAILGGVGIEFLQLLRSIDPIASTSVGMGHYLIGFLSSFLTGWLALMLLMKLMLQDKLIYFVWYCLALGIACILFFNVLK